MPRLNILEYHLAKSRVLETVPFSLNEFKNLERFGFDSPDTAELDVHIDKCRDIIKAGNDTTGRFQTAVEAILTYKANLKYAIFHENDSKRTKLNRDMFTIIHKLAGEEYDHPSLQIEDAIEVGRLATIIRSTY